MPPPVNIDFANAIDLGALPASTSQNVHDAGTTYTVFYKFTASQTEEVGVWGYGGGGTYVPGCQIFDSLHVAYPTATPIISGFDTPVHFPVTSGQLYYIKFLKNGNFSPANLTINVQFAVHNPVPSGSLIVTSDRDALSVWTGARADGTTLRFILGIAGGEGGDILPSGIMMLEDQELGNVVLYDGNFTQITSFALAPSIGSLSIRSNKVNKFYISQTLANSKIYRYLDTGVLDTSWTLTGIPHISGLCPSNDESKIYLSGTTGVALDTLIRVWDTGSSSFLADLVTGPANHSSVQDILVMTDGSIVIIWNKFTAVTDTTLIRYSSAGAVLNTIAYGAVAGFISDRLAYDDVDQNFFWVMVHLNTGFIRFQRIKFSDFSVNITFDVTEFFEGIYQPAPNASPGRFGPEASCPFLISRTSISTTERSGLYVMVKNKTDDTLYTSPSGSDTIDVKIPNPLFQTALVSDDSESA